MMSQRQPFRVGWASCEVTPDWPVNLQGQFYVRLTREVLDPLTATALALESADGTVGFILISVDAANIKDIVRQVMTRRLKVWMPSFDPDRIVLHATHTHTAPQQSGEGWYPPLPEGYRPAEVYGEFLGERLADLAAQAWDARRPGGIAWAYSHAAIGSCRRLVYSHGQALMYGRPDDPTFSHVEGGSDDSVDQLFTFDEGGRLTGVVINVACPAQCIEHGLQMSADYWHCVRVVLRERFGPSLFVLPQCGAAGDQSPHMVLYRGTEERMYRLRGWLSEGHSFDLVQREVLARRLRAAVEEGLEAARQDLRTEIELAYEKRSLAVPLRRLTPVEVAEAKRVIEECRRREAELAGEDPWSRERSANHARRRFFENTLDRVRRMAAGETTMSVDLHAARIGETALITNRFEYYLDFGQRIRGRSKAVQTFVVQLAGPGSYLPTPRAAEGGSYGAWFASAQVAPEAGAQIAEESIRLINQWF